MNRANRKALTQAYNGITNTIFTDIHVSGPVKPDLSGAGITLESCGAKQFPGLWDTGASNSVISADVISACGMSPIGLTTVSTANGIVETGVYFASLFLPNGVVVPSLRVTEGCLGENLHVLIGMDVIALGDFAVTNLDGKTVFSFQMPSHTKIDFVHGIKTPVGRNEPCPCGSGKKYKHCHGK